MHRSHRSATKNLCSVPGLECDFPLGLNVIQFSLYSHEDISTKYHFTGGVKQYYEPVCYLKHLSLFSFNKHGTILIPNYEWMILMLMRYEWCLSELYTNHSYRIFIKKGYLCNNEDKTLESGSVTHKDSSYKLITPRGWSRNEYRTVLHYTQRYTNLALVLRSDNFNAMLLRQCTDNLAHTCGLYGQGTSRWGC